MNFVVYGKKVCPSCENAKKALEVAGYEYTYYDVMMDEDAMDFVIEKGFKTVPQIFCDGDYVGGYESLLEHLKTV